MSIPTHEVDSNMSKPTHEVEEVTDLAGEVTETEVVEVAEEVATDNLDINEVRSAMGLKPKDAVEETEEDVEELEPETEPEEEFDEITYNQETVKIPVSKRKDFLQKGYNYDKQQDQLDSYKQKVKELESLIGLDLDTALAQIKVTNAKEEIDEYATTHEVTVEEAKELIEKDKKIKELEFKNDARNHKDKAIEKKKELENELYFKELEPDIDALIQENIDKGQMIDVETAYRYLLGSKAKELIESNKKDTEKRTLANVQDRAKRTIQKEVASDTSAILLSEEAKTMAREMGVSIKSLKKRLAKKRSD